MRPNTLGLPGPSLWDMARGFRAVRSDSIKFLEQTHSTYGDLVALPVPGPPVLLLGDPEAVRRVLHANAANWTEATRHYSRWLLEVRLLTSTGSRCSHPGRCGPDLV